MDKNEDVREMTPEELAEYINYQDEDTIVSITIIEILKGGYHAWEKDI